MSGVRPHGDRRREAQLRDLVLHADVGQPGGQALGPLVHALRGLGLRRLRAHLVGLGVERVDLPLGVRPLLLAAALVGLPLLQVALPAEVVDVDLGPVGVEVPHLVDDGLEQLDVVADHDQAAAVAGEEAAQPGDRVGVEVVGRLVEQQRLGVGEQDPGQLDAAALATGQGAQRLGEHPVGQAQVAADARRVGLGGVPAHRGELVLEPPVPAHRLVPLGVVGRLGHGDLRLGELILEDVEAPAGEHPVAGGDVQVAAAGVLGQVADLAGDLDLAGVRDALPGKRGQRGGLAGAVAADQADPVAGLHAEGGVADEDAATGTQLEAGRRDH